MLSTVRGNVLYIVRHSVKACACSAKLWMSHQFSIWFQRDSIFSAVDCIFMRWGGGGWRKSALKPSKYSKETFQNVLLNPTCGEIFDKCSFHWECNSVTLQFQDSEMRPVLWWRRWFGAGGAAFTVCAHELTSQRRCKCLLTAGDCSPTFHIAFAADWKNNPNVDDVIEWNIKAAFIACPFQSRVQSAWMDELKRSFLPSSLSN